MPITKIFTDPEHHRSFHRGELIDLLKPFIGKHEGYSDVERKGEYGISENDYEFTPNMEDCDVAVLPMSWNYYRRTRNMVKTIIFVNKAIAAKKNILSWTSGDFGVDVPDLSNLLVLRPNGYLSKLPNTHFGIPPFFQDPFRKYNFKNDFLLREWTPKPTVGFCGQAKGSILQYLGSIIRTGFRNLKYYSGISPLQPQTIVPPSLFLRARVLTAIEKDSRVQSNFIKRSKYRAGATTKEEQKKTAFEFIDNMINSDYIVCVRGGGNFSVRFYETLAMGRIPVFVNTDCLLPFSQEIRWKEHVVWVESSEVDQIGDKILAFHAQLDPVSFLDLQQANRKLWLEKLTLGGFFNNLKSNLYNYFERVM